MSRLALFDLFADLVGNRKSFLLPLLDSIDDEDWVSKEFDSLDQFLMFVDRTVKVPPEIRNAILRHYKEKTTELPFDDAKVTELTMAFLFIVVLAIAPIFRPASPKSFLFRSNLNSPAFAMISGNTPSRIGLRDREELQRYYYCGKTHV